MRCPKAALCRGCDLPKKEKKGGGFFSSFVVAQRFTGKYVVFCGRFDKRGGNEGYMKIFFCAVGSTMLSGHLYIFLLCRGVPSYWYVRGVDEVKRGSYIRRPRPETSLFGCEGPLLGEGGTDAVAGANSKGRGGKREGAGQGNEPKHNTHQTQ